MLSEDELTVVILVETAKREQREADWWAEVSRYSSSEAIRVWAHEHALAPHMVYA